jgi:ACT domain-containing protein
MKASSAGCSRPFPISATPIFEVVIETAPFRDVLERTMKAVITVLGCDRVGIIAAVTAVLAESNTNILDISQTIMADIFTMIMMVDLSKATMDCQELQEQLKERGTALGVEIRLQRDEIFRSMHRI